MSGQEVQGQGRRGVALVVCAPSGAGKTTLVKRLLQEFSNFAYSVSYTTRAPREGEVDGQDYHFVDTDRFEALAKQGFFAEWANVHGNLYGTPLAAVQQNLDQGSDMLFDVDVQGARQLKDSLQATFVFILPPSRAELEARLGGRGTDTDEVVATRLKNAARELREARWFDFWVINDVLDTAYHELRCIYLSAACRPQAHPGFLDDMLRQWQI